MTHDAIQQWLDDLAALKPEQHQLITGLRDHILGMHPDMCDTWKYGGLLMGMGMGMGMGMHQHFCGIFAYRNHVSLEFGEGVQLDDPHAVLEGNGKHRRHIKLSHPSDVQEKQVVWYLQQACDLALAHDAS